MKNNSHFDTETDRFGNISQDGFVWCIRSKITRFDYLLSQQNSRQELSKNIKVMARKINDIFGRLFKNIYVRFITINVLKFAE